MDDAVGRGVGTGTLLALAVTVLIVLARCFVLPAGALADDFTPMTTFNGVACASSTVCLGVGIDASSGPSGATAPLNATSGELAAGSAVQLIAATGDLNGVSCPASNDCLAVGEDSTNSNGVAVPLNPSTGMVLAGQSAQSIPGIFIAGVACASSTQCLAVGHDPAGTGEAVALDPTTGEILSGQSVVTIAATGGVGLEGVACPSATLCVAVGENAAHSAGVAVPLDPATGAVLGGQSVQDVTHKGILDSLSCPSLSQCVAVGWGASEPSIAVPIDPSTGAVSSGQSDQSISQGAAMLVGVTCPSSSACVAVGNDAGDPSNGQAVPFDPTTGALRTGQSIQTLSGTGALNAVVCPTTSVCVTVGATFDASGAVTDLIDPITATAVDSPVAPTTTTTTTPSVTPTTSPAPGTNASGQMLAYTGIDATPLVLLGLGLLLGGSVIVGGASLISRRKVPPTH